MKKLVQFAFALPATAIILFSCNDDNQSGNNNKFLHVLQIDCESVVANCRNRPGLRFSGKAFGRWVEPVGKPGYFESKPYSYVVCCENIPALIDSMKSMHKLRQHWIRAQPDSMSKNITLPGNVQICVWYQKEFLDEGAFSYMWFGNSSVATLFYIDMDEFERLVRDIEERYRTCCLL